MRLAEIGDTLVDLGLFPFDPIIPSEYALKSSYRAGEEFVIPFMNRITYLFPEVKFGFSTQLRTPKIHEEWEVAERRRLTTGPRAVHCWHMDQSPDQWMFIWCNMAPTQLTRTPDWWNWVRHGSTPRDDFDPPDKNIIEIEPNHLYVFDNTKWFHRAHPDCSLSEFVGRWFFRHSQEKALIGRTIQFPDPDNTAL